MNKTLHLCAGLALLMSLTACDPDPIRPNPQPQPQPEKPVEPEKPTEPEKPQAKVFEAADFKPEMLVAGVLTLPEHFTSIAAHALDAQRAELQELVAPGVVELVPEVLMGAKKLRKLHLPKALRLGDKAVADCNSLVQLELSEVQEVGEGCFAACGALKSLHLPLLTKAGKEAFEQCNSLTKVDLPALEELGEAAFALCLNLAEIQMPRLAKMGDKAFYFDYNLRKITLGAAQPDIAATAFQNTSVAKELFVPAEAVAAYTDWANATHFISINGQMEALTHNFSAMPDGLRIQKKNGNNTLRRRGEDEISATNFVLTREVNVIGQDVFNGLEFADDELEGYFAAYGVEKLKEGAFYAHSGFSLIDLPNLTSMASGMFNDAKDIKYFMLPRLSHVPSNAFERTGIEYIQLQSATHIDKHAFAGCQNLKYLILGNTPPQTPPLEDKNSPLNNSIFGLDTGGSPVRTGQVTIVVPDEALPKYTDWASQYTQVKAVIPISQFKR